MYDSYKIMEHLEKEVDKKADSGIRNVTDLDTVVKLSEAMKNFAKAEYYCTVTEAMHEDGYSERRKRDSMGRYSKNDGMHHGYEVGNSYRSGYNEARDRYMDHKHSYRSTHSPESKKSMGESLTNFKENLLDELQGMMANADTREEREAFKEMFRAVGNLA